MKRIINGHFSASDSTRGLIDISAEEKDILIELFDSSERLINSLLDIPIQKLISVSKQMMGEAMKQDVVGLKKTYKLDAFKDAEITPEIETQVKQMYISSLKLFNDLKTKLDTQISEPYNLIGLTPTELISVIQFLQINVQQLFSLCNMSKEEFQSFILMTSDAAEQMGQKDGELIRRIKEQKWDAETDRLFEKKKSNTQIKMQNYYAILEIINAPYEGAIYGQIADA